jgi:hypothetical protein
LERGMDMNPFSFRTKTLNCLEKRIANSSTDP